MKIGVISEKPTHWSTKALLKAIRKHGHTPTFSKTDEVSLIVAGQASKSVGLEISGVDIIFRGDTP